MPAIDKRIAALDESFRNCRRNRHFYRETGPFQHTEGGTQYVVIVKICQTCDHEVHEYYNRRGEFYFARPYYPDGYLVKYTDKEKEEGVRLGPRAIASYEIRQVAKERSSLPRLREGDASPRQAR